MPERTDFRGLFTQAIFDCIKITQPNFELVILTIHELDLDIGIVRSDTFLKESGEPFPENDRRLESFNMCNNCLSCVQNM